MGETRKVVMRGGKRESCLTLDRPPPLDTPQGSRQTLLNAARSFDDTQ